MSKLNLKIGFIGAGNMGEAIVGALIRSDIFNPAMILIGDILEERLKTLNNAYGVQTTKDNADLFKKCDIVILAVKPQQMDQVLLKIAGQNNGKTIQKRKIIVSIAAGVSIQKIEDLLYPSLDEVTRKNMPIIRVMPNTPAIVLAGISGMSGNKHASIKDMEVARTIFEAMGKVIEFDEKDLDAVTSLSGAGPAYVFYLIESMIDAGIELGLDPNDASTLTIETVKGAIKLAEGQNESPECLRRKVTSPGGTTEAAFSVLESNRVKQNIIDAIKAGFLRSKELTAGKF